MMDTARFHYLLERYEKAAANEAEEAELLALFADAANTQVIDELLAESLAATAPDYIPDPKRLQPVIDRILDREPVPARVIRMRTGWGRRLQWTAVAVVIVLLTGIGLYLRQNRKEQPPIVQTNSQPTLDVLPGGNHATLTLANGQSIILDSAADGTLAAEGNTQIQKIHNNQLTYVPPTPFPGGGVAGETTGRDGEGGKEKGQQYNSLTTPRGGQYQLTLPDGTHVWLNAASSITYPTAFNGKERKVEITGEAYFEVARDAAKPFKVTVAGQTVEVLGTAFNINAYSDEAKVRTTLAEGKVKVYAAGVNKLLNPGEQAEANRDGSSLTLVAHADLDQTLAWKNGLFAFNSADLPTVMRQLARWYNVDVEYQGAIPTRRFSGEMGRTLSLNQVLRVLTKSHINYQIENGNKLIILPSN